MKCSWNTKTLSDETDVHNLLASLKGRRWLCRGQSRKHNNLLPRSCRDLMAETSRLQKLKLESQAIDLFRSSVKYFASNGECAALSDDIVALMVLRHYGVRTRLLDWSKSPYVATYFAVERHDGEDAELWAFDQDTYDKEGPKQWHEWPQCLDKDGEFQAGLTAFTIDEPPDWFICAFYPEGFPRQNAQNGLYSMTARFGCDHAAHIQRLLKSNDAQCRWTITKELKKQLRQWLHRDHGIWRGALYPDTAGAAETAASVYPEKRLT